MAVSEGDWGVEGLIRELTRGQGEFGGQDGRDRENAEVAKKGGARL